MPIDLKVGEYDHDPSDPLVREHVLQLCADERCVGNIASIPCLSTWSVVRGNTDDPLMAHSKPLRTSEHPLGVPKEDGTLPAKVVAANFMVDEVVASARAVVSHGGSFILGESLPRRSSRFPMVGREWQVGRFEDPRFLQLRSELGVAAIIFDQCMTRPDVQPESVPHKKTESLASPSIIRAARRLFSPLLCAHRQTHAPMTSAGGTATEHQWETYSTTPMNTLLAAEAVMQAIHEREPVMKWRACYMRQQEQTAARTRQRGR